VSDVTSYLVAHFEGHLSHLDVHKHVVLGSFLPADTRFITFLPEQPGYIFQI